MRQLEHPHRMPFWCPALRQKLQQGLLHHRGKLISRTISTSDENLNSITTQALFPLYKTCSRSICQSYRSNSISSDCRRATSVNTFIIEMLCLKQTLRATTQICSIWRKNAPLILLKFSQSQEKNKDHTSINAFVPTTAPTFPSNSSKQCCLRRVQYKKSDCKDGVL